jgi:hypothetical protein
LYSYTLYKFVTKRQKGPRTRADPMERPKLREMDRKFSS